MPAFTCDICGDRFSLPQDVVDRYPGWRPRYCWKHRGGNDDAGDPAPSARSPRPRNGLSAPRAEVLERYTEGPFDGVFTDGGAVPNPGPGGWGAVYVVDDAIVSELHGHDPETTNNRMELTALIEGAGLVPGGTDTVVYSDSRLAVRTINEWASGWKRRGWKRKSGPVENLDLVKKAYSLFESRPELRLEWIRGHSGARWNEYADALANEWRR